MKTKFYRILIVVLGIFLTLSSCEEYLDVVPELGLDESDVFSSYESARGYLDDCYKRLNDIHDWRSQGVNRAAMVCISDEAGSPFVADYEPQYSMANILNAGAWTNRPGTPELGWTGNERGLKPEQPVMANAFYSIRIANKVIEKVAEIPNITDAERDGLLGQAYFFRAWFYFQVIQRVGGMPIFDKAFTADADIDVERVTYSESSEWLLTDLDKAIGLLPDRWNDNEFGRATKGAAMAVKSMAALYAASPLMQNDLNSIQNSGYSQQWSERAAEYANNVIQYINAGSGGAGYRLMNGLEYKNIFYTDGFNASDESIWFRLNARNRDARRALRSNYLPQYFSGGTGNDATTYSNPTQNIVDMFEMTNGYPIEHPLSGYDDQNPFINRDPRLENNILIPGEEWGVRANGSPIYQELYVGGRDYNNQTTSTHTKNRLLSGYVCKKFIWPEANNFTAQWSLYELNTIYIRVSQIYLDYAEAMNEAYGPNADPKGYGLTAVAAINMIRNRVNMPNVLSEFTGSKDVFRDRIRNERAVELMWEYHRWFDLRRWMIAEDVFSKPIRGIRANPPSNHTSVSDKSSLDFTYDYIDLTTEQRVFSLRYYWYPVSQTDAQNLFLFKQNPGW